MLIAVGGDASDPRSMAECLKAPVDSVGPGTREKGALCVAELCLFDLRGTWGVLIGTGVFAELDVIQAALSIWVVGDLVAVTDCDCYQAASNSGACVLAPKGCRKQTISPWIDSFLGESEFGGIIKFAGADSVVDGMEQPGTGVVIRNPRCGVTVGDRLDISGCVSPIDRGHAPLPVAR